MNVYLAGLISTEAPESLHWREKAEDYLWEHGITAISPMNSKSGLEHVSKDGGLTDPRLTNADIVLRDLRDIMRSDIILAHLDLFGSKRPLIGTIAELAWAWEHRKPVVAVASEDNALMRSHPFITRFVAHYFADMESAMSHIVNYYSYEKH